MANANATVAPAKSFAYQDKLPSLPVPDLHQTLTKYLDSVKPHVSQEDFCKTEAIVREFENGQGQHLHSLLLERASQRRNWLEEWWQTEVYLAPRYPIYPLINFGGPAPRSAFPPCEGSQIPRAALFAYLTMKFWQLLRREEYPPQMQRGTPLCMEQLRRLFSSCRIPGEECDSFEFGFKTASQGKSPKHIVVLCNNQFWKLDIADENEKLYTPPELERAFSEIRKRSVGYSIPLGALTCLDRPTWAELRQHLINIDPVNRSRLHAIESSINVEIRSICISLTDELPSDETDLARLALAGDPRYGWADKGYVWHLHRNGLIDSNSDHGPFDAIVTVICTLYSNVELEKMGNRWTQGDPGQTPAFEQLKFTVDKKIEFGISKAYLLWKSVAENLDVLVLKFDRFALGFFRSIKLYGDTIIQLAIQLAYQRLYQKPAATYETATTRRFFHGRTETMRSCTIEAQNFARAILSPKSTQKQKIDLFKIAYERHNKLMKEAENAQGCDRHLMGLRMIAKENRQPDPKIFADPAWKLAGGDGNFILSTSFTGYSNVYGGVCPMCENGYGTFYKMTDEEITIILTAWKHSPETDVKEFSESLQWSLMAIYQLLTSNEAAKL